MAATATEVATTTINSARERPTDLPLRPVSGRRRHPNEVMAYVRGMIVVVAALKGGVGKTTTSVYLSALGAGGRRTATLIDADPQASAAEWLDNAEDEVFQRNDPRGGAPRAPAAKH